MKTSSLLIAVLYALPTMAQADTSTLAAHLQEELAADHAPISAALKARVQGLATVAIPGVLGEVLPGYFSHNVESLHGDFGQKQIKVLDPLTCTAEDANAVKDDAALRAEAKKTGLPLLVLGHSKGGAEALLTLMRDPALVRDGIVDQLVLIAGAVGGSAIADIHNAPGGQQICEGAYDLRRDIAHEKFAAALAALSADDRALLAEHISYVRTAKDSDDVAAVFAGSAHYLTDHFGPNDGMMMPPDEYLPGFGTDLGILNADHSDLVGWGMYTGSPPELKRAFTRALLRVLYGE